MPRHDFRTPRIFLDAPLSGGSEVALDRDQANYLINVLRLTKDDGVLLFNGRDGEWQAVLTGTGKRSLSAAVGERQREQPQPLDLHFLFAPLKHARLDYLVQKAVEMGVSRIQPVTTQHTQVARLNFDRMRANAIEAAQQCGVLIVTEITEPVTFKNLARRRRAAPDILRRGCRGGRSGGGIGRQTAGQLAQFAVGGSHRPGRWIFRGRA